MESASPEEPLRSVKKAFAHGMDGFIAGAGEFFEAGFLFGIQPGRDFHLDPGQKIAVTVALNVFDTATFQAKNSAALRADRNPDLDGSGQRGHLNFRAKSCLGETDRDFAKEVVAVALKKFVRFDVQENVQVA